MKRRICKDCGHGKSRHRWKSYRCEAADLVKFKGMRGRFRLSCFCDKFRGK